MSEQEKNEEKVEQTAKEVMLKNAQNGEKIQVFVTDSEKAKLKEIFDAYSEQSKKLIEENERLKKERTEKFENEFGKSGSSAPLNNQQTGEVLPSDNEGLPVDMQSWKSEFEMISDLEKQAQNGNVEAKKALAQLLAKATEKSFTYEYDGDPKDLYRVPKTEKERAELAEKRRLNWRRV